jgi:uncharacterized protein (DUF58 family)
VIPSRLLVLLAAAPAALALLWAIVPGLLPAVVALDVLLVLIAVADLRGEGVTVRVVRRHQPLASVGTAFPVTLELRHDAARPLALVLDDDGAGAVEGLPARVVVAPDTTATVTYRRTLDRRGRHVFGPTTVRWPSRLGLWERQVRVLPEQEDAVRVYPDFSFLRQEQLRARADDQLAPVQARRRAGGESEFRRLRPYVQGDPYRHIDWKATARRQQFVTREYGQESAQNVVFLLDAGRATTQVFGGITAFDHGLGAALAMGQAALRHGDRVGLLAFDSKVRAWLPPRGGAASSTHLVAATYDVFPSLEEPDYAAAFRHLAGSVRRRSLVVLITAVQDQVNADAAGAVVAALAGRHLPLCVWLRDPALDEVLARPGGDDDAWYHRAAVAELVRWQQEALAGWRARGALVVDVPANRLSSALLARYLEVKARRLL